MSLHRLVVSLAALAAAGVALGAQTPPPPTTYTLSATNTMAGPVTVMKVYRLGSKVVVDQRTPEPVAGGSMNIRTFYDLDKMEKFIWDPVNSNVTCVKQSFTGGWNNPITSASDVTKPGIAQLGAETVHGFAAKVVETPPTSDGSMKLWVDTKTNLVVKMQLIPPTGPPITMLEITDLDLTPPPASAFEIPAYCTAHAAPAAPAQAPGDLAEIASLTGDDAQNYLNAGDAPMTKDTCTVLFRVVKAGTMDPIPGGYQVGLDPSVDNQHLPAIDTSTDAAGHTVFKGGHMRDVTAQIHQGVLRIDGLAEAFEMDLEFGRPGSATALLYRHCFGPQTALLYVMKDPASAAAGGDWLWVKAGKFAAAAH